MSDNETEIENNCINCYSHNKHVMVNASFD